MFWMCCCTSPPPPPVQAVVLQQVLQGGIYYSTTPPNPGVFVADNFLATQPPGTWAIWAELLNQSHVVPFLYDTNPTFWFPQHFRYTYSVVAILEGVNIAQGATITAAKVTFNNAEVRTATSYKQYNSGTTLTNVNITENTALLGGRIRGALAGNKHGFTNYTELTTQTWTAATVSWPEIGSHLHANRPIQTFDTPEIKTIVQEIVNLPAWNPGNSITLWLEVLTSSSVMWDPYPWPSLTEYLWAPSVGDRRTDRSYYEVGLPRENVTYTIAA